MRYVSIRENLSDPPPTTLNLKEVRKEDKKKGGKMFRAHLDAAGIGVDLELKSSNGVSLVTRLAAIRNSLPLAANKSQFLADLLALVLSDLDSSSIPQGGADAAGVSPHVEVLEGVSPDNSSYKLSASLKQP